MEQADVYQHAAHLVRKHGPAVAWQHAVVRALEHSDLTGLATWARVVEAIDEMTRVRRRRDAIQ